MAKENSFRGRLAHAWNAFVQVEPDHIQRIDYGPQVQMQATRTRFRVGNERSITASIYTRIGIDVASIPLKHVRLDDNEMYLETIDDGLNQCLNIEANIDQGGRAFRQDIAMTLVEKGALAIVPVDTTLDPTVSGQYDINTMRVAEIVAWYANAVTVDLYNDTTGMRQQITLPKSMVAIVENPLYAVMNQPNSTLQRLIHKLSLLDSVDDKASNGSLDLIIQLPYVVKTEARREQAENRRKDIETQLNQSQYGIAYTDGTEKITQLNRAVENNLPVQIQSLTTQLYSELGLTPAVMNGTAAEPEMINYYNRTIEPILSAIAESMKRTFLTKTARTQQQSIEFYRDPFKLTTVADMATFADAFSRNEILTSNELRGVIGFRPASDPKADLLRNSNVPQNDPMSAQNNPQSAPTDPNAQPAPADNSASDAAQDQIVNSTFDQLDKSIDQMVSGNGG